MSDAPAGGSSEALLRGALAAATELSREFVLVCDSSGTVRACDARAGRVLGVGVGDALGSLAVRGTEAKVERLIARARAERVERWEVILRTPAQGATTVAFHGAPHEDGVVLVGSLVSEDYARSLAQVSDVLSELSTLHRETARQENELRRRHDELLRLSRELDDSGRGVVALHAELADKNEVLQRVSESRSRVVANVSHELRTPINSILGLARLLLGQLDGPLNPEQEKQIGFIQRSAEALSEIVNDVLDLSKLEAGRSTLHATRVQVSELLAAVRGMMRPLATNPDVALVFESGADAGVLETDEGKVAQVLRNLVSNALKFTERGEVRVSVEPRGDDKVAFHVEDTGIGIAYADQQKVFEEFTQIESSLQKKHKGTGLGLTLSQHLATMLGGELSLRSEPGRGSRFTLVVPRVHPDVVEMADLRKRSETLDPARAPVLVVEDDTQTMFLYEKYLQGSGFQVVPARSIDDARAVLRRLRPAAVVLDVMLEGETSWAFLAEMKLDEGLRDVPVLVVTVTDREQKARALGADEFSVKPMNQQWLLKKLAAMARLGPVAKVLVIDDDEVARYLVRKLLDGQPYEVIEAASGVEGVRRARAELPHAIILDFLMPDQTAFEVLDELKRDPRTRSIPVIINTSQRLNPGERERLAQDTAAILSKQSLSREVAIARIREALLKVGGVGG